MINSFVMVIKLQKMNLTAQELTNRMLSGFPGSSDCFCRKCKSGDMMQWCDYKRKLTDLRNGRIVDYVLETKRFKCNTCDSTHALLVPLIIPYGHHSVLVVISALYMYFKTGSVQKVCSRYQISAPTLYRWKALFLKHKEDWLGYLKNVEMDSYMFLWMLRKQVNYSELSRQFMQNRTDRRTFLQNHKNADNHRFV